MFVGAKRRKTVVNKVTCNYKTTYLLITETHSNMDARKCTPVKYHIHSYLGSKNIYRVIFLLYSTANCTLFMSEITNYFIRSVFIGSKCPNLSGISTEEPPHSWQYTIKLVMFNTTNRGRDLMFATKYKYSIYVRYLSPIISTSSVAHWISSSTLNLGSCVRPQLSATLLFCIEFYIFYEIVVICINR